ncbi:MAG: PAS domain S-box protein [Proteobacteria bacterium]|nr:PAS domain S-box protein [Pseudomonadota bacterium]
MTKTISDPAIHKPPPDSTAGATGIIRSELFLKAGALQDAIFNSANFSCIATDEKGVIQIFNVGAERMLGYAAAEVLNKFTPADISDPQEVIARAEALSVDLETRVAPGVEALVFKASRRIEDVYELTYIRKDGSRFPAVVSVTALRDADDGIIGYLLIGTDNTARKQIEAEKQRFLAVQEEMNARLQQTNLTLKVSEEKLTVTLNSIGDAVITTDADARVTLLNPLAERLTGWTQMEAIGRPVVEVVDIINKETRQHSAIPVMATLAHGMIKGLANHTILIARDGSEHDIADSCAPIRDHTGQVIGAVMVFRDVTDDYAAQQALQDKNVDLENARAMAEKASLAKSTFLSSISHELRTPLNAILGFAQLLESGSPSPTEQQLERLHQITKAGWYLLELINEILDLAVIESGKLSLSRESVSLSEIMRECQTMIEPQAQMRGIRMGFMSFDSSWHANVDRTRATQVLINLLSNAIKYNRENGTVEVKCSCTPERLRISIKDSGAGLSPEQLLQLFLPFNRLGQENGTEEGTGIGLAFTKQLIELMGGSISVESTVGVGSEFVIELIRDVMPRLAAGNTMPTESAKHSLGSGGATRRTLLYVEDNPANLMLVEQIIEGQPNIRMLSARDGNSGVAFARAHLPDVILMDINLPGISGIEAMNILRKDPATRHIPIIALSANAMLRDITKGLEAGFFRYLTKPIKINEFMNALDDALKFTAGNDSATGLARLA